jgi:peptide/nickel transport system permease protein
MFAFIVRRVLQAIVVMLIISFIGFALKQNVGDPVREMTGISVSAAERDAIRERLGLNDPFLVQYGRFLKGAVLEGNIGQSFFYKKPAMEVIVSKAPATLELVMVCSVLIVVLSIPMGIYSAIYPKRLLSRLIMGFSTIGVSVPIFLIAILLIYVFSIKLGWLPSYGRGETVNIWGWESGLLTLDGLQHLLLPATALTALMLPLFVRLIRSEMMRCADETLIRRGPRTGRGVAHLIRSRLQRNAPASSPWRRNDSGPCRFTTSRRRRPWAGWAFSFWSVGAPDTCSLWPTSYRGW